eukprot:365309-Chlamydomonas_euryale.AAC.4
MEALTTASMHVRLLVSGSVSDGLGTEIPTHRSRLPAAVTFGIAAGASTIGHGCETWLLRSFAVVPSGTAASGADPPLPATA